jgi:hypothetical protein
VALLATSLSIVISRLQDGGERGRISGAFATAKLCVSYLEKVCALLGVTCERVSDDTC